MVDATLAQRAKDFAVRAHMQQTYGDGEAFIRHPAAVAAQLLQWRYGPEFVAAGWLHDVVEDTRFTVEDLEGLFGGRVALLVAHLTVTGDTPAAKLADNMAKLEQYPRAAIVRLADRLCNVRAALPGDKYHRRYAGEHATFEATVRPKVPPALWTAYALALRALDDVVNAA